jgi:hypothetical protein
MAGPERPSSDLAPARRLRVGVRTWIIFVVLLVVGVAGLAFLIGRQSDRSTLYTHLDRPALETEKLREEVRQLRIANDDAHSARGTLISLAPFLTATVAILGLFATLWKQIDERGRQAREDRAQRAKERIEDERDERRRLDEKFTSIVASLGAESESLQASAAVALLTFLKPGYEEFVDQVFRVALVNTKLAHSKSVGRLLVDVLEQALRAKLAQQAEPFELDLTRAQLQRIDLSNVDLTRHEVDIAFARLENANFTSATFPKGARGYGVSLEGARLSRGTFLEARLQKAKAARSQWHGATLVSADLKGADLRKAQFEQARLQGAHFDGAALEEAGFEQATVSDTFFTGARFSESSLLSLTKAKRWRDAHFDVEIRKRLDELAPNAGPGP